MESIEDIPKSDKKRNQYNLSIVSDQLKRSSGFKKPLCPITPKSLYHKDCQTNLYCLMQDYMQACQDSCSLPTRTNFCQKYCLSRGYKINYNSMKSQIVFSQIWNNVYSYVENSSKCTDNYKEFIEF